MSTPPTDLAMRDNPPPYRMLRGVAAVTTAAAWIGGALFAVGGVVHAIQAPPAAAGSVVRGLAVGVGVWVVLTVCAEGLRLAIDAVDCLRIIAERHVNPPRPSPKDQCSQTG